MSDDITFCFNSKCRNKGCERHQSNIKIPYREHSFSFFKDCKYWGIPETVYVGQNSDEWMKMEGENDAE